MAFAALAAFLFVWLLVAVRVIRRDDIGPLGKVLWIVAILVVPVLGLLAYFIWDAARPLSA